MLHRILVPIASFDSVGKFIFQEALELAQATRANLRLLHVLSLDDKDTPGILSLMNTSESKKRWEEFEKPGLDLLKSFANEAIAAGVSTEYSQILGSPSRIICETAKTWEADLIVMGRRGITGISEFILGSVSNYVTHHAPCSVLVVQSSTSDESENFKETELANISSR
ncbi:universal stress protein [Fischerella sp. JS2]|uniref:universal stress protein n=1 Tax=Fischerella sp. JS2 TaxID=2597771 RepID=UPI0028EACCF7|nr:universal stress protein [Fischerella sp. JS2]